jgi:hypothetical protein
MEDPQMDAPLTGSLTGPLNGVVPVVPTIFHDDQSVDLSGTVRVVDYLMDAGVDGLCLLANYSEQFSLTDAERDEIASALLERVAGRLPVIVTTSHYSVRVAVARSRAAQEMGAAMVMLTWSGRCHRRDTPRSRCRGQRTSCTRWSVHSAAACLAPSMERSRSP